MRGPIPVTREASPKDPGAREPGAIVFGAAPREMVLEHCRAVAAAGREATRLELEPYALRAAVGLADHLAGPEREPGAVAVVEIGASRSGIHVFGSPPWATPGSRAHGRTSDSRARARTVADLLTSVPLPGAGVLMGDGSPTDMESEVGPARPRQLSADRVAG